MVTGTLYELDGNKAGPVSHGPATPETFLEDAAKVAQEFFDRNPGSLKFNMIALCG